MNNNLLNQYNQDNYDIDELFDNFFNVKPIQI